MKQHAKKCKAYTENKYGTCDSNSMVENAKQEKLCDCDGYHTFGELYEHRIQLWIAFCGMRANVMDANDSPYFEDVWRSKRHSDGELAFGGTWFVLGVGKDNGEQITYHLPIEKWDECDFAEELEKAPEWDGHTSDDVLERLKKL